MHARLGIGFSGRPKAVFREVAYADHQQDYGRRDCRFDIRHSELGVSWLRRKNGWAGQRVQVSGRMPDGLASDLGENGFGARQCTIKKPVRPLWMVNRSTCDQFVIANQPSSGFLQLAASRRLLTACCASCAVPHRRLKDAVTAGRQVSDCRLLIQAAFPKPRSRCYQISCNQ
jgi:hypothetical protein